MLLQIKFQDGNSEWTVRNERHHQQKDGFNCGPVAMLKLLEIFGHIKVGALDIIAYTSAGYRGFVMNFYKMLKDKYYDSLVVECKLSTNDDSNIAFLTPANTMTLQTEEPVNTAPRMTECTKPVDTPANTATPQTEEPADTAPTLQTEEPVNTAVHQAC
jgi:hypothetical protein